MARDNHPRERQARKLARKKASRPPFDRVLIVTEGSTTEPLYFEDIRKQKRIPTAHIEILPGALGTQPRQIVDYAHQRFLETRAFERVYAVFDRDDHTTYADALNRARQLDNTLKNDERKLVTFKAVPSVPCFELWLLLHFEDVLAFTHRTQVIGKLGARISGYTKGANGIYARTEALLPQATARAAHLRTQYQADTGTDPYSDVDELVALLRGLRS
jgi:hypothetical protein